MHPIVISDIETFRRFESGAEVTVHPVMMPDYLERIERDGNLVEVWYQSNAHPHPHHIGRVLAIGGTVESIPLTGPQAIAIKVKVHQHLPPVQIPLS